MDKEFLYRLLKTKSPSGYETDIQRVIIEKLGHDFKFFTHHSGNLVSGFNTDSSVKIMTSAHVDEIGLMISRINSNGTCNVVSVGGIDPLCYLSSKVCVIHEGTHVHGVFGYGRKSKKDKIEVKDLILDLGVDSYDEAKRLVSVGDYVVHHEDVYELNGRLAARALDDRIGAFICASALMRGREYGSENGCYFASTVGEETTMRGAVFASNMIKPSMAIVVDVTFCSDVEGGSESSGDIRLGGGPVLCHSSIVNRVLNRRIESIARRYDIPLQYEVAPARTGTDADRIYFEESGIPVVLVSVPLRYMHSPSEVCDYKDVEWCIELISRLYCEIIGGNNEYMCGFDDMINELKEYE